MIESERGGTTLYQWDINQRLIFTNAEVGTQIHFSSLNDSEPNAIVTVAYSENGRVYSNIPNILLQNQGTIHVYVYPIRNEEGHSEQHVTLKVLPREKPSDYVYTETELLSYEKLAEKSQQTIEKSLELLNPIREIVDSIQGFSRSLIYEKLTGYLRVNEHYTIENGDVYIRIPYAEIFGDDSGSLYNWTNFDELTHEEICFEQDSQYYDVYGKFPFVLNSHSYNKFRTPGTFRPATNRTSNGSVMLMGQLDFGVSKYKATVTIKGDYPTAPEEVGGFDACTNNIVEIRIFEFESAFRNTLLNESNFVANSHYYIRIYKTEYNFPSDINKALDALNGEVI